MSKHKHECNRVLVLDTRFQDPEDEEDPDEDDDEEEPSVSLSIVYWVYDKATKKVTGINYIPRVSWATTGVNFGGKGSNKKEYVSLKVTFVHDQLTQCNINFDRRCIVNKPTKSVLTWIKDKFRIDPFGNNQDDHKT